MTNFSWHDEDDLDENWEDTAAQSTGWPSDTTNQQTVNEEENGRSWPIRPLWLVLTAVLISAIGLTFWFSNQRVQNINDQLTTEIGSSHDLLKTSLTEGDFEIFISLLSGSDKNWAENQIAYFQEIDTWSQITDSNDTLNLDTLIAPLDLEPAANTATAPATITLNPDFSQGEARTQTTYIDVWADEIVLETSRFYGPGQERWLAMAPPEDYFGIETQQASQRGEILIDYRSQDESFVDVLLPSISTLWETLCHPDLQLQCPTDPTILVTFDYEQDGNFYHQIDTIYLADIENMIVQIQSPLVFGNPAEATSRERLVDTVIRQLAADFIWELGGMKYTLDSTGHDTLCDKDQPAEGSDFSSCVNRYQQTLRAAVAVELGQLGLHPRPEITAADIEQYFKEPFLLDDQAPVIQEKWASPLIIAYLYEEKGASIGAIGHYLSTPELGLASLVTFSNGDSADFSHYLQTKWEEQTASSRPDIGQPIMTVCLDPSQENSWGFQYNPATQRWEQTDVESGWSALHIMPNDQRQIQSTNLIDSLEIKRTLYTDTAGRTFQIHEADNELDQWQVADPRYNRAGHFGFTSISRSRTNVFYHEVNEANCTSESCPTQTYAELPSWSPDHVHYLATKSNGTFVLHNTADQSAVDLGFSFGPYSWLNESEYIYPDLISVRDGTAYYRRHISSGQEEQLFLWQTILDQIDQTRYNTQGWVPNTIEILPERNHILVMYTQQFQNGPGYILFVDWQTGELKGVAESQSIYGSPYYSPDARWLIWETHGHPSTLIDLTTFTQVHHFDPPAAAPYSGRFYNTFDWSTDGRWLLQFNHGFLHVIDTQTVRPSDPASGQLNGTRYPIVYPAGLTTCNGGGFIKEE